MKGQFDCEGKDESNCTETIINLEQHFKNNGLSEIGFNKLKEDIDNGDMRVDVLIECTEKELDELANDYKFTILQKKSFIKAVKLLPNSKANVSNTNNNNTNIRHIYITPQEQKVFMKIQQLTNTLNQHSLQCTNVQNKNKQTIENGIELLKHYGNAVKQAIDEVINTAVQKVNFY